MVEQRAFNPLVQGSSPWGRTLLNGDVARNSCKLVSMALLHWPIGWRGHYELGVEALDRRLRVAAAFDELTEAI
jgi:hypothetical protein